MALFGRGLFHFKKDEKPKQLYDFAQHGLLSNVGDLVGYAIVERPSQGDTTNPNTGKKLSKKQKEKVVITAKGIYKLECLNENNFAIKADPKYIQEQVDVAKEKLSMLPKKQKIKMDGRWLEAGGPEAYAVDELESIIERLQNRLKIKDHSDMVAKYPHTSSALMEKVLAENNHLECRKASSFVPDFPTEAIKAMKEYDEMCVKLCNKKTNFYVIADRKDFQKVNKRRDPILLAQSPFGFFWQILGAWDEEMIYLGDL